MTFPRALPLLVACLSLFWPPLAAAADLAGTVRDQAGGVIGGAEIVVQTAQGAVVATETTNAEGKFAVPGLPAGQYVLVVRAEAFEARRLAVDVPARGTRSVDITLDVGGLQEEVTVSATPGSAEELRRAVPSVNVINADEIGQRTKTVAAEAVAEEVGVQLQRTSPSVAGVFVRGLTGNKVNVFVDGVRYTTGAQRGGINTFLDLIEPSSLESIEVVRGPSSAEYGSDAIGGSVQFRSQVPTLADAGGDPFGGTFTATAGSAHQQAGGNLSVSWRGQRVGLFANLAGRHVGAIRTGGARDSHAAVTRFFDVPSTRLMDQRLPDTGFDQVGGQAKLNWTVDSATHVVANYMYGRQNGGARYDQLLGGDGNLIADLNGVTLNLFYVRLERLSAGWFDYASLTYSLNTQREERVNQGGNGNARATIGHEPERTTAHGVQGSVMRALSSRQTLTLGGDVYFEGFRSSAFNVNPATGTVTTRRPRIPDDATYRHGGAFAETSIEAVPSRLRMVGAVRAGGIAYNARSSDSPLVNDQPLWPDDSVTAASVTFRAGLVASPTDDWTFAVDVSRGFRAPHMTDLGTLGLTGSGFEIAAPDVQGMPATVGTRADSQAVSSGRAVGQVGPETSLSYDFGVRFRRSRVRADVALFINTVRDNIQKQALILPQGAVGMVIGGQPIVAQNANGGVYVAAATNPVLVRANYDDARIWGIEHTGEFKLTKSLTLNTVATYLRAKDTETGLAPNIEGGSPAPDGYLMLRYTAPSGRWWAQAYLHAALRQSRLSTLDLEDRRTGATRSRTSIRNFFYNGAAARGWVGPGPDGVAGTSDDVLIVTGETLAQVQDRVLGAGVASAPLFTAVPGFATIGIRGGWKFGPHEITIDAQNLGDRNYRGVSWGVDAPGRGVAVRYLMRF